MKLRNVLNTKTPKSPLQKKGSSSIRIRNSKWLSFPYILWMIGFIIIPILVILYYGLTNTDISLTLDNVLAILDPINLRSLRLALGLSWKSTVICLLLKTSLL